MKCKYKIWSLKLNSDVSIKDRKMEGIFLEIQTSNKNSLTLVFSNKVERTRFFGVT